MQVMPEKCRAEFRYICETYVGLAEGVVRAGGPARTWLGPVYAVPEQDELAPDTKDAVIRPNRHSSPGCSGVVPQSYQPGQPSP